MNEFSEIFRARTKKFALNIIKLYQMMPRSGEARVVGNQLLRSGTSVAANYRAAGRARSGREFFSKMSIVIEEADETLFWLELTEESGIFKNDFTRQLSLEAEEIVKIVVSIRTKLNQKKKQ